MSIIRSNQVKAYVKKVYNMLTPEYYNTSPVFVYKLDFDGFDKMISPSGLLSKLFCTYNLGVDTHVALSRFIEHYDDDEKSDCDVCTWYIQCCGLYPQNKFR